jgi:UDP-N-acetylmuramoylalanine--D-glutamate ligase
VTVGPADPAPGVTAGPELAVGDLAGLAVCVAGLRVVGISAARQLRRLGAEVTVVEAKDTEVEQARAKPLRAEGVTVRLGQAERPPAGTRLLVVSPGFRPDSPLVLAAAAEGIPIWGDVELAWRLRPPGAAPWLAVTGTNGKTTTVRMLAAMLTAAGHRAAAVGNVGPPLLDAVLAEPGYDVLAVELSSFQLHWSASARPLAAAVLNIAPDHLDWHGSLAAYTAAKARVLAGCQRVAVLNEDRPETGALLATTTLSADVRVVATTLGPPGPGQLGVVEDLLVDRAFTEDPSVAEELAALADVRPFAPHNVANALAAAALARAYQVPASAVRAGLRAFEPEPHRISEVAEVGGVRYVDDSKATNAHAAGASLAAYPSVVWIAGGLAKGASFDELVAGAAGRLRAVVLIGADRAVIADALARHAPDVPVTQVERADTGAMAEVVALAAGHARPGDVVLLAPACASMDMFTSYVARGEEFAAAVRELSGRLPDGSAPGRPAR